MWQTLLWLLFALWWGGLTFYAAVVVPIGTVQLGSLDQGFITQQVTGWHNFLLLLMTACLGREAWVRNRKALRLLFGGFVVLAAALFLMHSRLTGHMDFESQTVPDTFYFEHQIYLWLTVCEWFLGLGWAFLLDERKSCKK